MKKLFLSVCLAFAFFVASAVAQMAPSGGSQGSQNSSPSTQQPSQQPGMAQPDNNSPSAQTDQGAASQNHNTGEHKLKGCIQSQGGQYVLETKKGKTVALTGQDVSAHAGHEVALKGTWDSGMSAASSGNAGASGRTFNVSSVDMISDTCSGKGSHHSGNMDHSSPGTGSSTGSSTTQPPQ